MTDYYVIGTGHTAYGPYTLSDARQVARAFAHDHDGEKSAEIVGTVEMTYSKLYDDEMPPEPNWDEVHTPWRG